MRIADYFQEPSEKPYVDVLDQSKKSIIELK
jgi:hypothetical protein